MIHNRPVLGGNASGEIRVHTEGIHGRANKILDLIDTPHYPNSDPQALEADKHRMKNMMALKNVDYYLSHTMNSVEMKDGRIHAVQAMETGQRYAQTVYRNTISRQHRRRLARPHVRLRIPLWA